jgi:hypothetical protein
MSQMESTLLERICCWLLVHQFRGFKNTRQAQERHLRLFDVLDVALQQY